MKFEHVSSFLQLLSSKSQQMKLLRNLDTLIAEPIYSDLQPICRNVLQWWCVPAQYIMMKLGRKKSTVEQLL